MNRGNSGTMISSNGTSDDLSDVKLYKDQRTTPSSRSCPCCGHELDDCNMNLVGFPAGVRFDPSDQELIEHLESLVKDGGSRAHPLINDFIPTIQGDDGICYTHPENLPGVTRDGLSKHFFHRPSKAYPTGTRKRRKILSDRGQHNSEDVGVGEARWHKTGKTRPLIVGGRQKGCKKILVLYTNYGKQGKPKKTNWVMHQYHLGMSEDEKDGELVVSKVFYQTQLRCAATIIEQNDEKVEVTSEATSNILSVSSAAAATAAAVTMVELQQHLQQGQAHGHGKCRFLPAKLFHEVGAEDPVSIYQGQLHGNHHIPSQHHVQSLHTKPDTSMSFVVTKALNTESTEVSHAVQHVSALLTNGFHSPAILLRNKKQQDQQRRWQKDDSRKSCSLGEATIACQTTSTEEDDASTRPIEIQRAYQCWPPDHH